MAKKETKKKEQTIKDAKVSDATTDNSEVAYLKEQASTLLELAKSIGLEDNFLFNTTFNRYLTQLELLKKLKEDFNKGESLVNKEYVKGRENITAHPLITKINQTIDSANKTASLLFKLISNAESIKRNIEWPSKLDMELDEDISDLEFYNKYKVSRKEALEHLENVRIDNEFFLD